MPFPLLTSVNSSNWRWEVVEKLIITSTWEDLKNDFPVEEPNNSCIYSGVARCNSCAWTELKLEDYDQLHMITTEREPEIEQSLMLVSSAQFPLHSGNHSRFIKLLLFMLARKVRNSTGNFRACASFFETFTGTNNSEGCIYNSTPFCKRKRDRNETFAFRVCFTLNEAGGRAQLYSQQHEHYLAIKNVAWFRTFFFQFWI